MCAFVRGNVVEYDIKTPVQSVTGVLDMNVKQFHVFFPHRGAQWAPLIKRLYNNSITHWYSLALLLNVWLLYSSTESKYHFISFWGQKGSVGVITVCNELENKSVLSNSSVNFNNNCHSQSTKRHLIQMNSFHCSSIVQLEAIRHT